MTKDSVLRAIQSERKQLERRLAVLGEMEARVRTAPAPNGVSLNRPHAPAGALREAILASLRGQGAMFSIDLKKKVKADGWDRHLNSQVFTKTLRALSDEKLITKCSNGSYSTYAIRRR